LQNSLLELKKNTILKLLDDLSNEQLLLDFVLL